MMFFTTATLWYAGWPAACRVTFTTSALTKRTSPTKEPMVSFTPSLVAVTLVTFRF